MTFCADWNNYDHASQMIIQSQGTEIEKLQRDLKTQLMDFMTWHSGDEQSKLPEGMEEIIDTYLKK